MRLCLTCLPNYCLSCTPIAIAPYLAFTVFKSPACQPDCLNVHALCPYPTVVYCTLLAHLPVGLSTHLPALPATPSLLPPSLLTWIAWSLQVYAPSRIVVVYAPAEECDKDADLKSWGIPGLAVKGLGPYYAR
ncbi:hypothetical protein V8C86DRAFT_969987 [Haematococcus lacustris]